MKVSGTGKRASNLTEREGQVADTLWEVVRSTDRAPQADEAQTVTIEEFNTRYNIANKLGLDSRESLNWAADSLNLMLDTKALSTTTPLTAEVLNKALATVVKIDKGSEVVARTPEDADATHHYRFMTTEISAAELNKIYDDNRDGKVTIAEVIDPANKQEKAELENNLEKQLEQYALDNKGNHAVLRPTDIERSNEIDVSRDKLAETPNR
ncbi:MAG: hypothetical protein COV36_06605 [Alphaproteobacteria bacterium CG11_big_fil_rev_8_21_14_0_20_44_7]|nr:MAG: hypothetical protein COV36_06605 [Alphaproteobacteria bacterium CG11_big_fil_rev_8_21_14_0_20_44_7]